MIAINEQVEFVTMNDREKYLFDLQGFLVVRDFLSNTEVSVLNQAIDANPDKRFEHPRADLDGMLTWPDPWCQPFSPSTCASQGYSIPQHLAGLRLETGSFR